LADPIKPARSTTVERIVTLIETLKGENGCPWDKKQTPETMARYLLEEVHELADAIISKDADAVCEEAGDVLFQLLFVITLFRDAGQFGFEEVVEKNIEKMIRRHPHVFGDVTADTPETVSENWEKIKRKEKGSAGDPSILSAIPQSLPALLRASMVSERAAKTGFDWDDITGVMAKTMEEWSEFSTEVSQAEGPVGSDKAAMEFGDVLFTMVNVARFAHIHPETALIRAIHKFEKRFNYMEKKAVEAGRDIDSLTFKEMHHFWDEAKERLG
jgi:tetrapyrrole methylase family protein/MazG family protein